MLRKYFALVCVLVMLLSAAAFAEERPVNPNFSSPGGKAKQDPYRPENQYYSDGTIRTEYLYNDSGNVGQILNCNRYGRATSEETVTSWNQNGYILKSTCSSPLSWGKYSLEHREYSYDGKGNRIAGQSVYRDGSFAGSWKAEYDDQGRTAGYTYYGEDGTVSSVRKDYRYDEDGHLLGYTMMDGDGKITGYYNAYWIGDVRIISETVGPEGELQNRAVYDTVYGDSLFSEDYKGSRVTDRRIYTYYPDHYTREWFDYDYGDLSVATMSVDGKTTRYVSYDLDRGNGSWTYDYTTEYSVNAQGRDTETSVYADGTRYERVRDQDGNLQYSASYNADGTYNYGYTYEYDSAGLNVRTSRVTENGTVESYTLYKYDSRGNAVDETTYKADGSFFYRYVNEYDSMGQRIRQESRSASGALESYTVYEYDSEGFISYSCDYDAAGTRRWESFYRTLNDGTRQSRFISYNSDGTVYKDYGWEEY